MRAARRRRAALPTLLGALIATMALVWAVAAGADTAGELVVQPSLGAPTLTFLGASPEEAPGEVWATAKGNRTLARFTDAGGWELVAAPPAPADQEVFLAFGSGVGRTTPRGGVVVAGQHEDEAGEFVHALVVRDPGGALRQAADPSAVLEGEGLFGFAGGQRILAATDEPDGRTGALVVPEELGRVLFYDGTEWSSEDVCLEATPGCTPPESGFEALAIDAGEGEAWLLGRGAAPGEGLELFHREGGSPPRWRQVSLGPASSIGSRWAQEAPGGIEVSARLKGQMLTATAAGVWIDAQLDEGSGVEGATLYYDAAQGEVTGSWCDGVASLCALPLAAQLPVGQGRSFAWPPSGSSGQFGTRTITGVGAGAVLNLEGTGFRRLTFVGGSAGSDQGAALSGPDEGWLGATPPLRLTRNPDAARVQSWPVPLRRPLLALAAEPEAAVGDLDSEALAVGAQGQVARYVPGVGWEPEFLLRSSGKRATPNLRAVAWPEAGIAYAVGDGAAFWRWQEATGLWQADPGSPPNLARANMTGIAFDPADPSRGYAIGKQGVLLGFGRAWKPEELPAGVPEEANLTSIAFAGSEALVTYKYLENDKGTYRYRGGLIVNDGSGWRRETAIDPVLGGAVPQRVAGLPDSGAAVATMTAGEGGQQAEGIVVERQGPGGSWAAAAGGTVGFPTGLAAVREGGVVRAVLSVAPIQGSRQGDLEFEVDKEQLESQPPVGQAPLLTDPYPLPVNGLIVRQTASGWRDEQQQTYPLPAAQGGHTLYDLPVRPDPVLALLVAPDGSGGWAVGGETGTAVQYRTAEIRTAAVMRYGQAAEPPSNAAAAAIPTVGGTATFALGANAQCLAACADYAGAGLGPDRWLRAAVSRAATVSGLRAFLYAGAGVAATDGSPLAEAPLAESIGGSGFQREQDAYARRLGSAAGSMPVFAAPAESDLDADGSLATFSAAFGSFGAPLGAGGAGAGVSPVSQSGAGQEYYAFDSGGSGGAVRVVVLDYSRPALGDPQRCWLAQRLSGARAASRPAIVVGSRDLAGLAANTASDRLQAIQTLVGVGAPTGCVLPGPAGAASAYLFDFPEQNRAYRLNAGGRSLPAYGSGTLGYVTPPAPTDTEFAGASGFLLLSVDVAGRDPATNVAPVGAQLVPSIGSLALDATDGTLLRRSQPALFEGLARRPLAGSGCEGGSAAPAQCSFLSPPPYVPIPTECVGSNCATSLFPEYTFTSSEPDIADFVAPDPGSTNPRNVQLIDKKPVLDSHSGLLCAFNAGTTMVTVTAGGISYSQQVTVQAGTVQQPCGTTPLRSRSAGNGEPQAPPSPAPAPESSPLPNETPPAPPPPPASLPAPTQPVAKAVAPIPPAAVPFFAVPAVTAVPLVPIVPPPPLPAVQPTPPSGTSQVNVTEEEEEQEEAYDMVSQMSSLPSPGPARATLLAESSGGRGVPLLVPTIALIAALAAAGIGGSRRGRRHPAFQSANPNNRRYR